MSRRRIGPIGTVSRLMVAAALLYLALFDGTSWGLTWYDGLLGLALLPGVMLALGLLARRLGSGPLRFTGPGGLMLNCAVIVALLANPYTAAGAELFYGLTLLLAAWRAQPGCEATVLSNWILRRDDQVGCPAFTPIDQLEATVNERKPERRAPAQRSPLASDHRGSKPGRRAGGAPFAPRAREATHEEERRLR